MTTPTGDLEVGVDVGVEPGPETVVPTRGRGRHARSADSGTDVPAPSAASPVTTSHTISAPATTVTTASTARVKSRVGVARRGMETSRSRACPTRTLQTT